ncbi:MAG TPA: cobalamin-binding protein [Desulfobacteraceae bacterium]|nr:cobalamin-binding protein [Deltaproteobacteria bacterium]HDI60313.1 cobalamin-binding protein [Desulfobacteraceae bacterium]
MRWRIIHNLRLTLIFFLPMVLLAAVTAAGQTRRVTDLAGRTMQVPIDPQRVVSMAPSATEIVFAIGRQDRLVGVSRFSDTPAAARSLPKVGSYVHLDLERIVALKPDLCLAIRDGNPKVVVDRLEAMQIPVYAVDPRDLESVMETIAALGDLLNAREAAQRLVDDMQQRIAAVDRRVARASHRPRVFLQIGMTPIVSAGTSTFLHELITRAGGVNVAAGATVYPRFSQEQVIALAPEVLIITSMNREGLFQRALAEWRRWPQVPAVANNRVHIVDSNCLDRPSPRLVEGLEQLARLIHPNLFEASP